MRVSRRAVPGTVVPSRRIAVPGTLTCARSGSGFPGLGHADKMDHESLVQHSLDDTTCVSRLHKTTLAIAEEHRPWGVD